MRGLSVPLWAPVLVGLCASFAGAQDSTALKPDVDAPDALRHDKRGLPTVDTAALDKRGPVDTTPAAAPKPSNDSTVQPSSPPPMHGMGRGQRPPMMHPRAPAPDSTNSIAAAPEPQGGPSDTEIDEDQALEIKLKTDPEAARRYRSPRKAFFLSLMLPGAGQVYCGSYVKAGLFAATEIGLGVAWWRVAIVGARDKENEAEKYAAAHWRQQRYEEDWVRLYADTTAIKNAAVSATAPNRQAYCEVIYGAGTKENLAYNACLDPPTTDHQYSLHSSHFSVGGVNSTDSTSWSQDSVLAFRSHNIKDLTTFYDVIGRYSEFSSGWEDNANTTTVSSLQEYFRLATDNDPSTVPVDPWGESAMRQHYQGLRARADQLARMQKWFLGGMVLNHLAAAFDAALQASRMNRSLLDLQTSWLDGIGVQGGLALGGGIPSLEARVGWSF